MLLDASAPNGLLIGIDRDPDALNFARENLKAFGERVKLVRGNFMEMKQICHKEHILKVDGILMDLGVSSDQLDHGHRGFSFKKPDEPLDMRMDPAADLTAADILNHFPEEEIRDIIYRLGEERWAAAIAKEITTIRKNTPFKQVRDLISAIKRAIPAGARHGRRHMATKTFQALRIFINKELESLKEGLHEGLSLLAPQGRMAVISFHSLEDRIVKQTFRDAEKNPESFGAVGFRILTRRPIQPSKNEIRKNPRARSAKLRAIERILS
jgi:16S rRNA (cytosine1402-N4)-methyltransferase